MTSLGWIRASAAFASVVLVGGILAIGLSESSGASGGGLRAKPAAHLHNSDKTLVRGRGLKPGDEVVLVQCLRTATTPIGCDLATISLPITVGPTGKIAPTSFTVATGLIGTGTCGTNASDAGSCEIAADDITSATTFVAHVNITFSRAGTSTTLPVGTTLPTLPTTLPTLPTTLPTLPVTLPTLPVTLPTLPVTLPSGG